MKALHLDTIALLLSGKLLLRKEIPLDDRQFHTLLNHRLITPVSSIVRERFTWKCQRCGNRHRFLFSSLDKASIYCRKCIEMGKVIKSECLYIWSGAIPTWKKYEAACSWNGELTLAQAKAAERIVQAIQKRESTLLIWAVCGAGKTEMLFPGMEEALRYGMRICIATPRTDVVLELKPRIKKAFSTVPIDALYGGSKVKLATAQVVICTTHQLLRFQHAFDLIIIDEIDAFPYHKDPSLAFAAKRAKKLNSTTVYLTATPRFKFRLQMATKQLSYTFVPIRFHGYPLPIPKLKLCRSLRKNLQYSTPPPALLHWIQQRENKGRQLLIFLPTVEITRKFEKSLTTFFLKHGIIIMPSALGCVHAQDEDRNWKIKQFREKEIQVLLTTTILERGVTFPAVDVAVLDAGHEVFDEAALVQIAGRAGRSFDDPTGEIIFFHDGKTIAMIKAVEMIKEMNKQGGF